MAAPGAAIFGCAGPALGPDERAFFREADPWGFILFSRNIEDAAQLRRLTADLRAAVGRDAPVLIDQEGGRVARLRPPLARDWAPPLDAVAGLPEAAAARLLWLRYRLIAEELRGLGIDTNCAPLADIAGPATHPVLLNRCYGHDAARVVRLARAVAEGLAAGGVLPVLKHIPGHGRASADSHLELPRVEAPRAELDASDFAAFRALADLPLAMTAHVVFAAIDAGAPATLSPPVIGVVRNEIGFRGLLMTDDLSMHALSGSFAERTRRALAAGCDLILHCNGERAEMAAIAAEAGRLPPAAAAAAEAALALRAQRQPADLARLAAEHADLASHG
jgi:beta-N-acetylhexosaminidase